MFVRWFFIVGGCVFLLAALVLREFSSEAAHTVALTFAILGFFWVAPQLLIMALGRNRP